MSELFRLLLYMYVLSWIFVIFQIILGLVGAPVGLCLLRKPNALLLFGMGWHSIQAIAFAALSAMAVVNLQSGSHFGWWYYPTTFIYFGSLIASCYPSNRSNTDDNPTGIAFLAGLGSFIIFCIWPSLLNSTIFVDCAHWADWFLSGWWTRGWVGDVLFILVLGRFAIFVLSLGFGVIFAPILMIMAFVTEWRERSGSKQTALSIEATAKRAA